MNQMQGFALAFVSMLSLSLARNTAAATGAAGLIGTVRSATTLSPLPDAKVSLKYGSHVVYTRADGSFTLPFDRGAGVRAPERAQGAGLRNGRYHFHADAGGMVGLELFNVAGRRLAARRDRILGPGRHSLDVTGMLSRLRGVGWLRVTADGRTEGFRVCMPGIADLAVAGPTGTATGSGTGAAGNVLAAKLAGSVETRDTLRVDLAGYLVARIPVPDSMLDAGRTFKVELSKDPEYLPDAGTVDAWKSFFERPAHRIVISRTNVSVPENSAGSVIVTADGREVPHWQTGACAPEPPPKALRLVYARDGREYRDTIDLAPFWAFHESFRTRVDSLDQGNFHAYSTWTWPTRLSVLPERDVLTVFQDLSFGGIQYYSFPDIYQQAGTPSIDGPVRRYGEPDPRSGEIMLRSQKPLVTGYMALFTLARREGHDLRVQLESRPYPPQPMHAEFLNGWPDDGMVRADQVLRLQGRLYPQGGNDFLEMSLGPAWESQGSFLDYLWRSPWDGSPLDWKFPFPTRDTVTFRLRIRKEQYTSCDGLDESPALKFAPDPTDTTVSAFEPNDSDAEAPMIEDGRWHAAALDFRARRPEDVDYFRFQGVSGGRVRLSLRNHDGEEAGLYQDFAGPSSGIVVGRGKESSVEYQAPGNGIYWFRIEGRPGRYEFRIDKVE